MKKYLSIGMLLILVSFSLCISPITEAANNSFHPAGEPVLSATDVLSDSDVIIESVQTIVPKWQITFLFPATDSTEILKGAFISFKFLNDAFCFSELAGFITVVHHQSNYLS